MSGFPGGSDTAGSSDFVIARFSKSDLGLVNVNNYGKSGNDYFESVIKSGNHFIVAGWSESDLSCLKGGSDTAGGYDFVIARFED